MTANRSKTPETLPLGGSKAAGLGVLGAGKTTSATQLIYSLFKNELIGDADEVCWMCGGPAFKPTPKKNFIKETFTDHDKIADPKSGVVCAACAWCAAEANPDIKRLSAKADGGEETTQKARSYSWFVHEERAVYLTKSMKTRMAEMLTLGEFPQLAVVSDSGQKHLIFRARVNPPGQRAGWVQFEEQTVWVDAEELARCLGVSRALIEMGFSKTEVETGNYGATNLRLAKNQAAFFDQEKTARKMRQSRVWALAVWLTPAKERK